MPHARRHIHDSSVCLRAAAAEPAQPQGVAASNRMCVAYTTFHFRSERSHGLNAETRPHVGIPHTQSLCTVCAHICMALLFTTRARVLSGVPYLCVACAQNRSESKTVGIHKCARTIKRMDLWTTRRVNIELTLGARFVCVYVRNHTQSVSASWAAPSDSASLQCTALSLYLAARFYPVSFALLVGCGCK